MSFHKSWNAFYGKLGYKNVFNGIPFIRNFAKKVEQTKELKVNKQTEEYREMLDWWDNIQKQKLNLNVIDNELRNEFIDARNVYKNETLKRIERMKDVINISKERKNDAMNAMPMRLSFACQITKNPKWKQELPEFVNNTFNILTYKDGPHPKYSCMNTNTNTRDDITQISSNNDNDSNNEIDTSYKNSVLPIYPQIYDPNDIRTQPSHVRSYFDYNWKEGIEAPIKESEVDTIDGEIISNRDIYGFDSFNEIKFSEIMKLKSDEFGTDYHKKLLNEQKMTQKDKQMMRQKQKELKEKQKERESNAKYIYEQKRKREQTMNKIVQWERKFTKKGLNIAKLEEKKRKKKGGKAAPDASFIDQTNIKKKSDSKRIDELEIIDESLPKLEMLLINKDINVKFFETTLPVIMNSNLADKTKKDNAKMLFRQYVNIAEHVGYGNKHMYGKPT